MSSTNRSRAREAHVSDYYVTPQSTIREFLVAFNQDMPADLAAVFKNKSLRILDPCAGGDPLHGMAYPIGLTAHSGWLVEQLDTFDIRPDSLAAFKEDYLFSSPPHAGAYDLAITNPPFNIALDVIQKALRDVGRGGLVIMLLRLNFFGSQTRFGFWRDNMPLFSYVHSNRCKFTGTGNTDSIEYMHAVWQVGNPQRFTQLRII